MCEVVTALGLPRVTLRATPKGSSPAPNTNRATAPQGFQFCAEGLAIFMTRAFVAVSTECNHFNCVNRHRQFCWKPR